jgi:hypothetical protein
MSLSEVLWDDLLMRLEFFGRVRHPSPIAGSPIYQHLMMRNASPCQGFIRQGTVGASWAVKQG